MLEAMFLSSIVVLIITFIITSPKSKINTDELIVKFDWYEKVKIDDDIGENGWYESVTDDDESEGEYNDSDSEYIPVTDDESEDDSESDEEGDDDDDEITIWEDEDEEDDINDSDYVEEFEDEESDSDDSGYEEESDNEEHIVQIPMIKIYRPNYCLRSYNQTIIN